MMDNCNRCGRCIFGHQVPSPALGRKKRLCVRRRYGRGSVDMIQAHFGMLVMCTKRANAIYLQKCRLRNVGNLLVIVALNILAVVLVLA